MTLAEAIRKGIPLIPHMKGSAFHFDASGRDWAEGHAHRKPILGADALGTALVGMVGDPARAVERVYDGPEGSPLSILRRLYPRLWQIREQCPECKAKSAWSSPVPLILVDIVWHVQDDHGWSREKVAQFLEERKI